MSRRFAFLISCVCMGAIVMVPLLLLLLLFNIDWFASMAQQKLGLAILWSSVETWQWVVQWALTAVYCSIGLLGLYFLQRAFIKIARGEWFSVENSLNLRRFAVLLMIQAVATPIFLMFSSVLLSWNHPAGQKTLSIVFGSGEIKTLMLAMIIWVVSDLLLAGGKLQSENRQFV